MAGILNTLARKLVGLSLPYKATTGRMFASKGALSHLVDPTEKLLMHGSMHPIHELRDEPMFLSDLYNLSKQFTNDQGYMTPFVYPRRLISPLTYEDAYSNYWKNDLDMPKGVYKGYSEYDPQIGDEFPFTYEDLLKHEFYANPQSLLTPLASRFRD